MAPLSYTGSAMTAALIDVIIPVYNEQDSIGYVLADIPRNWVRQVVVVDNGSTDQSASIANQAGARVVHEPRRGYGAACLAGLAVIDRSPPEIVVFLDGDYSDHPDQLPLLVTPILEDQADMVIGSRMRRRQPKGALTLQGRFGNALATGLLRIFFGVQYTDLGPFRAIRYQSLMRLGMCDRDYGWTVEMQIKAARQGLRYEEIPVKYRPRIGESKISGTLSGCLKAGYKILFTLARHA